MGFITFNKSKIAANNYCRYIYSEYMAGRERDDPSSVMFHLGMVFAVGDQKSKQLALRDAGLSAPPLGDMDFAQGHDFAATTYNQIRRGEIRYNN